MGFKKKELLMKRLIWLLEELMDAKIAEALDKHLDEYKHEEQPYEPNSTN